MIDQFDILVTENNDDVTVNVTNNLEEVVDIFVAEAGEEIELNITNNIVELNIIRGAVNLSLTTNNNSGAATYDNITGVLNIPQYTLTGLGATTVGSNLVTLENPNTTSFIRINANNTVQALGAVAFRTAIGAGTITSVGLTSSTSGVTIGSSPITTSGNITLAIATASGSQQGLLSSTDWTTFNNKQNALTNPITGTGAAGQVAFWNGTNTQTGDSGLVWDNVNKRLGVGGTPGAFRLDVNGTARVTGAMSLGVTGTAGRVNFARSSDGIMIGGIYTSGQNLVIENASQAVIFSSQAVERMRLASTTGNVLIGTTTDAGFRLDVNGTARITSTLNTDADAVVNGVNIGRGGGAISSNTRVGVATLASNTTGSFNASFSNSALRLNTTGSANSAFGAETLENNTTGIGNSGFGSGSLRFNTTGSLNSALGRNAGRFIADGTTSNTITTNSIYIGFNTKALADNQTNQIVIGHDATGLGSNTTVLGNSSTLATAIYGNLLLGTTTNSTFRLDVNGTARVSSSITAGSFIRSGGTSAQYLMADGSVSTLSNPITGTGTNNFLPKFTGASTLGNSLIFDNGTNVGIGTTSPVTALHVIGAGTFSSSVTANGNATTTPSFIANNVSGAGGTAQHYIDFTAGATVISRMSRGNGASGLVANGLNIDNFDGFGIRLNQLGGSGGNFIIQGGNVGIGTTSASERLTVSGNVLATAFFASSDIRLKNIIKTNYNPTGIEAISYKWKDSGIDTKMHIGYSAQQVQEFMPDAVSKDSNGKLSVNYVEVLVAKIASLEAKVKQLEAN
jgi:hypothetical protein